MAHVQKFGKCIVHAQTCREYYSAKKREGNLASLEIRDKPGGHCAKQKNLEREKQGLQDQKLGVGWGRGTEILIKG